MENMILKLAPVIVEPNEPPQNQTLIHGIKTKKPGGSQHSAFLSEQFRTCPESNGLASLLSRFSGHFVGLVPTI